MVNQSDTSLLSTITDIANNFSQLWKNASLNRYCKAWFLGGLFNVSIIGGKKIPFFTQDWMENMKEDECYVPRRAPNSWASNS